MAEFNIVEQIGEPLRRNGYVSFSRAANDTLSIRKIGDYLECNVTHYSFLKPRISTARQNSLSNVYGIGEFPAHSDGAHLVNPPDYLIMRGSRSRKAPTLLWPSGKLLEALGSAANNAEFAVNRGGRTFGARFCTVAAGGLRLRFNHDTMKPKNQSAATIHSWLREPTIAPVVIDWETTSLLVVDNRTVLHGRGRSEEHDAGFLRRWTLRKR
ncbi:hypothetical protein C8N30_2248 [Sulfitobacter guttiformis]|uniref:TfdA family taurine catabolism dioxygenase TauD n=1 Tax=Sulfitobacter guttiformis TaxID=74349 RepID=A0A420DTI3_9RHOB|nr:hypothetical protein C8N30_2248 [Sulfitobacter guttiformis]